MSAFVRFWGTRGSIPTPGHGTRVYGGNTSCVELRFGDVLVICDGGTGLRELGLDLLDRVGDQALEAHLFFSHTHWDHIQGFPFFGPAYRPSTRLHVWDVEPGDDRVYRLLCGQMRHDYFPVSFADLGAEIESRHFQAHRTSLDGVAVTAHVQEHPGTSFGFAFEHDGKKIVYATDNELDRLLVDGKAALERPDARRLCPPAVVDFVSGAELLIADGQYTDDEYVAKRGWGHARASTLVDLALQAGVKQLAIFHHDPAHSDADVDRIVRSCRQRAERLGGELVVFAAREGVELKV